MTDLVAFYRGEAPDDHGRRLQEIWQWDDERLEDIHNYIQVLFPNREPSAFNPTAPLLDGAVIAAFRGDELLRFNLATSFDVILRFYGLEYRPETQEVVPTADFAHKAANWLHRYNHNYLRITRILKCLMALGLPDEARAFYRRLEQIYRKHPEAIGAETLAYWSEAVEG